MTDALRVTGLKWTVYCLCGAEASGWERPGEVPEWGKAFIAVHPRGVDGHGPATKQQAQAARQRRQPANALPLFAKEG